MKSNYDINLKILLFNAFASNPRPTATEIIRSDVAYQEADQLCELLTTKTSADLTPYEIRTIVESNLWMLTPKAFLYFLPAFLYASLVSYPSVSVFASELIGSLTAPSRSDIVEALDQFAQSPSELDLPKDMVELIRKQQLEWFDSGMPTSIFYDRFDNLPHAEGQAILAFFRAFQEAYGADFPFNELEKAVERYWDRYE
jgi:hypothetical protein